MADNIVLDPGSGGSTIKTDDDGTAHWQYVKIAYGADNTQTRVTSGAPLPVDVSDSSTRDLGIATVDNAGTFAVQVDGDALTALQLIDDVVVTDDAAMTLGTAKGIPIMGYAGTQSVNANDAAILACDTDGALHISDGGNTITVDGTVTANLSATDNAVLDSIDAAVNGTLAVSGTVTANLSATDNAVLDNIQTAVELIDNAISGTEMQVDVVAPLPAGTNAIGKLAANSGVDIGDVDILSIAAGSNLVGDVGLGVRTSGGATPYYNNGTQTETQIKGSGGQIYTIVATNTSASARYLQLFNNLAASVTPGTTTPTNEFYIPTQGDTNGAGIVISLPVPLAYGTGITFFISTTKGGATAATANDVLLNIGYA